MLGQDVFGRGQNPWSLVISLLNPLEPTGFFLHYAIPSGCSLGGNEDACPLHKHSNCPLAFFPVLPLTSWAEALLLHYQGFAMTQEPALSFLRSQVPGAQEFSQSCLAISFLLWASTIDWMGMEGVQKEMQSCVWSLAAYRYCNNPAIKASARSGIRIEMKWG